MVCNFIKKETLVQVFSCEFREISKNTFFAEHLRASAFYSENAVQKTLRQIYKNMDFSTERVFILTFEMF